MRIELRFTSVITVLIGLMGICSAHAQSRPCDVINGGAAPCVAAYSTTRALYSSYHGSLYQVKRISDSATLDIGLTTDGYANAAAQDGFCASSSCAIMEIYDQSGNGNHLFPAPSGEAAPGPCSGYDCPAVADAMPVTLNGHKVYGLYIVPGMGYRNNSTTGVAGSGQPEGVYMVSSGVNDNGNCCFDFGNAEVNNWDNGKTHMDALSLMCFGTPCTPLSGLDMEDGIYPQPFPMIPLGLEFVTAAGTNDGQNYYATYWGNAQSGTLATSGALSLHTIGYAPMHQEGGIILGIGGDNSNWGEGTFYEGAMTAGVPTGATLSSVQSNIAAAAYSGFLPYHDGFASGSTSGWSTYNGSWSTSGNTYVNSAVDTGGDKAVTGSPQWDKYTVQGDVQITGSGSGESDAGLIFRVNSPAAGADSMDGYYLGLSTGGSMFLGRENYGWTLLNAVTVPGGISPNAWYHLTVQAVGCTFTVTAQPAGSTAVTGFTYTDSGCASATGAVGVRSFNAAAIWRGISVSQGGTASDATYYAPFASGAGPSGWTTYDGTWTRSGEDYVNSAVDTLGDKSIGGPTFTNFTVNGDVQITSGNGDAGFLVRATNPANGTDSFDGYYVAINSVGSMYVGKESYGWTLLGQVAGLNLVPGNTWYHLTARVIGCTIRVTAQPLDTATPANEVTATDPNCSFSSGQIGVRTYNTSAQWRYLSVTPN